MELKEYTIIALPFAQSDLTATFEEFAADESTALDQFEKRYPNFRVKSVTEK